MWNVHKYKKIILKMLTILAYMTTFVPVPILTSPTGHSPGSLSYWPTAELENQAKSLTTPSSGLHIILDSTVKEILGLGPGLEKSTARDKSRGKTHLLIAFSKNVNIFQN
jgi:hypothetical protein